MTVKDLKEKIFYIIVGTVIPIFITKMLNRGDEVSILKEEFNKQNSNISTEIQIIHEKNRSRELTINELNYRVQKLEESRNNLSDYYVTRAEFNRVIETQQKTIDKIDKNVEKIVEKVMYK